MQFLRFASPAATLALLVLVVPLSSVVQIIFLVLLLLGALISALRWLSAKSENADSFRALALAFLALAAAGSGASAAVLGFGVNLLLGHSLLALIQGAPKARLPLVILTGLALSGLPFTPTHAAISLYASPSSPLAYLFLLPQGLLLAGTLRRGWLPKVDAQAGEPLTRSVRGLSLVLMPAVYILFGLGLASQMGVDLSLPIWPPLVIIIVAGAAFTVVRSGRSVLPPQWSLARLPSLAWFGRSFEYLANGLRWMLTFISRLLEGEAGVLWALLLIALLLSLIAQSGLTGS